MKEKEFFAALFFFVVSACAGSGFGQESQSNPGGPSQPGEMTASKPDHARRFALLVEHVLSGKDAVEIELADLPQHPELLEFITAPPNGRYLVKQLTFAKDDEIRALSVAVHSPHDTFLIRGTETGGVFSGMYYVVDHTGFFQGAAAREGKTVTEVSRGDVWQGYEQEKAFWMWQAEQITNPTEPAR